MNTPRPAPALRSSAAAGSAATGRTPTQRGPARLTVAGSSAEARRWAAVILEVLAGVRTPPAAATALGVSLPRYYAGEVRALQGLLSACEPRPRGRVRTPARALAGLQHECDQLRRQCDRQQALLRVAQRTVGLPAAPPAPTTARGQGKKRRRRPTVRALRAAACLRQPDQPTAPADAATDTTPNL